MTPSWGVRLRIGGLTFLGHILGFACSSVLLLFVALGALVVPPLASLYDGLFIPFFLVFPILAAWACVSPYAKAIRPFVVSLASFILPAALFTVGQRLAGGHRSAFAAVLGAMVLVWPLAAVLGAFLATYFKPHNAEQAG